MKFTLEIVERVNLSNFEYVEVHGSVEFDLDEAKGDPADFAQKQLDVLLLSHRRRALRMLPEDSESFMNYHPALEK